MAHLMRCRGFLVFIVILGHAITLSFPFVTATATRSPTTPGKFKMKDINEFLNSERSGLPSLLIIRTELTIIARA